MYGAHAINIEIDCDELRIRPSGEFNRAAARELMEVLRAEEAGWQRVVIDTAEMGRVHVMARDLFWDGLKNLPRLDQRLVFTGAMGRAMSRRRNLPVVSVGSSPWESGDAA
ncbi:hypothetical protein JCM31598_06570 [Desulfonatronum parangueonense]